jgi:hypothetical protein
MSVTDRVIGRRMLTAKVWDQSQDTMGETCNGEGGTNNIADYSGLPLPFFIPLLFHTASSVIQSVESGSSKGLKVYITVKNNYTVTCCADLVNRDLITVKIIRCIKNMRNVLVVHAD